MFPLTQSNAIISVCTSLKSGDAHVPGHMTGPSVRTLIPAKKLAGVIPGSFIIPVTRARSFVKARAVEVTRASSLTAYLSAGFTLLAIVRSRVKMVCYVVGGSVFLLILLISCESWFRVTPG